MTTDEIKQLLVEMLVGAVGEAPEYWSERLGRIEMRPAVENIHSNWRITPPPAGHSEAVANAIKIVRAEHPYVNEEPPSRPIA